MARRQGSRRQRHRHHQKTANGNGKRTVDSSTANSARSFGITAAWRAMKRASRKRSTLIPALREEFWKNVRVLGSNEEFNQSLEKAGRVADFFELAELMCIDAFDRNESCGGHFREEYQTPEGEALRDDEHIPTSRPGNTRVKAALPL